MFNIILMSIPFKEKGRNSCQEEFISFFFYNGEEVKHSVIPDGESKFLFISVAY